MNAMDTVGRTLTPTQAWELLRNTGGHLRLGHLEELDPKTAKVIARSAWLNLDGLKSVSDRVAKGLAATYAYLFLNGVAEMSGRSFALLMQTRGSLQVNGLRTVPVSAAETPVWRLAKPGVDRVVYLDGLRELSVQQANLLAACEGTLSLGGLTKVTPGVALALAHHGNGLHLDGLDELSPAVATGLSHHNWYLHLPRVTSLSAPSAEALVKHGGELSLTGLTTLDEDAARQLARYEGPLCIRLKTLSDGAAAALADHQCISDFSCDSMSQTAYEVLRRSGRCKVHRPGTR